MFLIGGIWFVGGRIFVGGGWDHFWGFVLLDAGEDCFFLVVGGFF
jgi:hypothetical protein